MSLSLPDFVATWQKSTLTERSAAQSHFNGLCDILGEPKPAEADPIGSEYTFEKGADKIDGSTGWADVWKRGYFGWEYKGKRKNLDDAYKQLLQYREDLENPPLLVTCDLNRFEVHTNFTNTATKIFKFDLADLLANVPTETCAVPPLEVLRLIFTDPGKLKPGLTTAQVTERAAKKFSVLAKSLRDRGIDPEKGAHFLMRLLFCLFSEGIGLLPKNVFSHLVMNNRSKPANFEQRLKLLFAAMSAPNGSFGADDIPYFNGGLFSDDQTYTLSPNDLEILAEATTLDWAHVEPAIFGTLFERSLDPANRAQLGAHYTSKEDISLIVEPVVMAPLRRRWNQVKADAEVLAAKAAAASGGAKTGYKNKLRELLMGFADEIANVRVLDPACGSGNFLYVVLKSLLDLEKQVSNFASNNFLSGLLPKTDPSQLYGIETNVYAHELASIVVWIGYLQWQHDNGYSFGASPILRPLTNIHRMDAVLAFDAEGKAAEPEWPSADFIVGNPPFLGDKKMRGELGDMYVDSLRDLYSGRVPGSADFVTYWFEKARAYVEQGEVKRAGLLATQGIRGGANRAVLNRIKESGDIFWAQSDRDWVLDGANVHVSMIGFDDGTESEKTLDDQLVTRINSDLSATAADLTTAKSLKENERLGFIGTQKGGNFDISNQLASTFLAAIGNPNGKPNSDVVKPWMNASDVTGRPRGMWVIDFGSSMPAGEAAKYEAPFEYLREHVLPHRATLRRDNHRLNWWRHAESRPGMRAALAGLSRYIVTPRHSKHRVFMWVNSEVVPDSALVAFARDDDYFFGVLHSRQHELWARATGTQVREKESGFRYTPIVCFNPFPLPWVPGKEPKDSGLKDNIADASRELVKLRDEWLNPPGANIHDLKERTLTNLYNKRFTWLDDAHRKLDEAVFAAYGWPTTLTDAEILERLLALNHERAAAQGKQETDSANA